MSDCILIVEDSPTQAASITYFLEEHGYKVVRAVNGEEGLAVTRKVKPALIISDIVMPVMNGYDMCRALKNDHEFKDVPVILLTSLIDTDDILQGLRSEADYYITKPYNEDYLLSKIRNIFSDSAGLKSEENEDGLQLFLSGKRHAITSNRQQVLRFLFSTYENAIQQNRDLIKAQNELQTLNDQLNINLHELQSSEERFRTLVVTIPDIVYRIDSEGRFIFINDAITNLGYEPEELISRHFGEIVLPADVENCSRTKVLPKYKGKITGDKKAPKLFDERRNGDRKTDGLEIRLLVKGGKRLHPGLIKMISDEVVVVEVNSAGTWGTNPNTDGKMFIGTVGVIRDISVRKRMEEDLKNAHDQLEIKVEERTAELETVNRELNKEVQERRAAEEQILRKSRLLEAINKVFAETLTAETEEDVARQCMAVAEELTESRFGLIGETNPDGRFDTMTISKPGWEACKLPVSDGTRLIKDMEISGIDRSTIRDGKSRIVNDPISHPDRVGTPEWHPEITSFLGVPLKRLDKTIGMIGLGNKESGYTIENQEDVEALSMAFVEALDRKRADRELIEGEARFRRLVETMPNGLSIADENEVITFVNERFCRMLGYSEKDLIYKSLYDLLDESNQEILRNQSAGRPEGDSESYDLVFIRPDGQKVYTLVSPRAIRDDSGRFIGTLGVITDITERKKMEIQLQQAQKLEALGGLAAGIAHEINTPTQYVGDNTRFLGNAFDDFLKINEEYEALVQAMKNGAAADEIIERIETAVDGVDMDFLKSEVPVAIAQTLEGVGRISSIVRSMKQFAHPGLDEKSAININQAIESTITVARNEWKYVAELETVFDDSAPPVPCVGGELNQVILNLIINASHAIADVVGDGSKGKGKITLSTRHIGEWVEIRISDTGAGIPEEIRTRIFDPFFTTKGVGKGTGQGLAIAYSVIVEKHGGILEFETEENVGTTFIVRLPLS